MKSEQIDDPQKFFDYLTSDEMIVLDGDLVTDNILEIRYEFGENFVRADPKTNVVIATFTTTNSRLQLYDELDMLKERVLYCDTDSLFYLTQPGQPEPNWGIILVILLTNWAVTTLRYLHLVDRKIIIRPI